MLLLRRCLLQFQGLSAAGWAGRGACARRVQGSCPGGRAAGRGCHWCCQCRRAVLRRHTVCTHGGKAARVLWHVTCVKHSRVLPGWRCVTWQHLPGEALVVQHNLHLHNHTCRWVAGGSAACKASCRVQDGTLTLAQYSLWGSSYNRSCCCCCCDRARAIQAGVGQYQLARLDGPRQAVATKNRRLCLHLYSVNTTTGA